MRALLRTGTSGPALDERDICGHGRSPLEVAVSSRNPTLVRELLAKGAPVAVVSASPSTVRRTAVHIAAALTPPEGPELLQMLLDAARSQGVDVLEAAVSARCDHAGSADVTPLHLAAAAGCTESVNALLKANASPIAGAFLRSACMRRTPADWASAAPLALRESIADAARNTQHVPRQRAAPSVDKAVALLEDLAWTAWDGTVEESIVEGTMMSLGARDAADLAGSGCAQRVTKADALRLLISAAQLAYNAASDGDDGDDADENSAVEAVLHGPLGSPHRARTMLARALSLLARDMPPASMLVVPGFGIEAVGPLRLLERALALNDSDADGLARYAVLLELNGERGFHVAQNGAVVTSAEVFAEAALERYGFAPARKVRLHARDLGPAALLSAALDAPSGEVRTRALLRERPALLVAAAANGDLAVVARACSAAPPAALECIDNRGWSVIHWTAAGESTAAPAALRALLGVHPELLYVAAADGTTPTLAAAFAGSTACAYVLKNAGARPPTDAELATWQPTLPFIIKASQLRGSWNNDYGELPSTVKDVNGEHKRHDLDCEVVAKGLTDVNAKRHARGLGPLSEDVIGWFKRRTMSGDNCNVYASTAANVPREDHPDKINDLSTTSSILKAAEGVVTDPPFSSFQVKKFNRQFNNALTWYHNFVDKFGKTAADDVFCGFFDVFTRAKKNIRVAEGCKDKLPHLNKVPKSCKSSTPSSAAAKRSQIFEGKREAAKASAQGREVVRVEQEVARAVEAARVEQARVSAHATATSSSYYYSSPSSGGGGGYSCGGGGGVGSWGGWSGGGGGGVSVDHRLSENRVAGFNMDGSPDGRYSRNK